MDPVSFAASVIGLAEVTFSVITLLNKVKGGGKERLRLLTELTSFWTILNVLKDRFESLEPDHEEPWMQGIITLAKDEGILEQTECAVIRLAEKLNPRPGRHGILRAITWSLEKDEIDRTIFHVHSLKQSIDLVLSDANIALSKENLDNSKIIKDAVTDARFEAVLDWLSPLNFSARQDAVFRESCRDTGKWLLESADFNTWLCSKGLLVWCPGIPGAGKTFLVSIATQHLRERFKDQNTAIIVLYCSYNDPYSQSMENLFGSILRQLLELRLRLPTELSKLYSSLSHKDIRPKLSDLLQLISAELHKFDRTYVVLDALDELYKEADRVLIIENIRKLHGDLSLMVTSRPGFDTLFTQVEHDKSCSSCNGKLSPVCYHCESCTKPLFVVCEGCHTGGALCSQNDHFFRKVFDSFHIKIEAAEEDIENYVAWRISQEPNLLRCVTKKPGLREEIVRRVTEQGQGL